MSWQSVFLHRICYNECGIGHLLSIHFFFCWYHWAPYKNPSNLIYSSSTPYQWCPPSKYHGCTFSYGRWQCTPYLTYLPPCLNGCFLGELGLDGSTLSFSNFLRTEPLEEVAQVLLWTRCLLPVTELTVSKHWRKTQSTDPKTWPRLPFPIHHQSLDERVVAVFTWLSVACTRRNVC